MSQPASLREWNASESFEPITYEKVVGLNNLLSIAWLSQGLTLAAAVARIVHPHGPGSGFLIAPDLLLTNNHVLPSAESAAAAQVQFNYQNNWAGVLQPTRSFSTDSSHFRTDYDLDYSIVRVAGSPGDIYGYIDLGVRADPSVNDYVTIIQHPNGGPKQISLTDNKVSAVFGDKVQYATDTEPGSSGSPVFNQSWQIVGLHHAGGGLAGPDGIKYFTNEGILIASVIADAAQFLGLGDPLYDLAFGDLRAVLVGLIDLSDPPATAEALLPDILWTRPAFAAALTQWTGLNSWPGHTAPSAAAAAGVAVGAALRQWARSAGHESIARVTPSNPPPSDALVALASPYNGTAGLPADVYSGILTALRSQPALVAPIADAAGAAGGAGTSLVLPARSFLTGVMVGAQAYEPARPAATADPSPASTVPAVPAPHPTGTPSAGMPR
jgi:V8-like Glu-specific endopeptidase